MEGRKSGVGKRYAPERRREGGREKRRRRWNALGSVGRRSGDGGARGAVLQRPQPRLGGAGRYMRASPRAGISSFPSCSLLCGSGCHPAARPRGRSWAS